MENNSESSFVIDVNYENPINYSLQFGSLDAQPFDSKKKEVAADEEQQNLRSNHPHPPPLGIKNKAVTVDEAQWLKPMIEKIDSDSNLEEEIMESEVDENMNKHENQLRRRYPESKTSPNVLPTALPMPEVEPPAVQDLLPMIDEVFRSLIENTKTIKGAKVENQKICVYVHFRNVDEKNWATLAQCVRDILKDYPRLRLTQRTKALEVRPAIDWNKGKAIESLLESLGLINNRTDEDAFKNPNNSMNSNKLYIEKISGGQIFAVINFIIEVPMLVFGQLLSSNHQILYAILAMSFSIMTMIVSIGEFIYRGRKASVVWRWRKIPWFYYPSPSRSKLFGSAIDILGLLCAIFQFIFSIIEFSFYIRHKDNPIKVSMWPPVFAFCVMWSQFLDNSSEMMLPRYRSTGDYNLN